MGEARTDHTQEEPNKGAPEPNDREKRRGELFIPKDSQRLGVPWLLRTRWGKTATDPLEKKGLPTLTTRDPLCSHSSHSMLLLQHGQAMRKTATENERRGGGVCACVERERAQMGDGEQVDEKEI